ncbi:hypothetical protein [Rhodoferax sp.]|uniref:hypothetical protein n=1 Tax=Rhodoferax sp. TaxID=50421 RepID=UPI0025E23A00|nr:hypothetical protein [Rhodoferax sp.]MCM2340111.1 hypothetical protein [Rhodoferax sp.]
MKYQYLTIKMLLTISMTTAITAIAGPFGMEKGMSLDALQSLGKFSPVESKKFVYRAKTLKQGHPDFEVYSVIITPSQGLCKITAFGKDFDTSSYGLELTSKYKDIKNSLKQKYGNTSQDLDFLMAGSIWKNSNEWMMSLRQKERKLMAMWDKEKSTLNDSLSAILLQAHAVSQTKGYLTLSYEFDNSDACLTELEASINSNL